MQRTSRVAYSATQGVASSVAGCGAEPDLVDQGVAGFVEARLVVVLEELGRAGTEPAKSTNSTSVSECATRVSAPTLAGDDRWDAIASFTAGNVRNALPILIHSRAVATHTSSW